VWLLLGYVAAAGALCAAQEVVDLGAHDIGGRGCLACHVVTTDPSGNTQYLWPGEISPADNSEPEDGWSHSARCLSCHDGVMAQVMDMGNVATRPKVSGPHPVNVGYQPDHGDLFPVRLMQGEWQLYNNPENPSTKLKLFSRSASDPTPTVQCATCHDPHNQGNGLFLRDPYGAGMTGITFCRTCHAEESQYAALP